MAKKRPTKTELQQEAQRRAPLVTRSGKVLADDDVQKLADEAERGYDVSRLRGQTVSSYVATQGGSRGTYNSDRTHLIPATRCTESMARSMGEFANQRGLSTSDAVRTLIQAGLDAEEGA